MNNEEKKGLIPLSKNSDKEKNYAKHLFNGNYNNSKNIKTKQKKLNKPIKYVFPHQHNLHLVVIYVDTEIEIIVFLAFFTLIPMYIFAKNIISREFYDSDIIFSFEASFYYTIFLLAGLIERPRRL